MILLIVSGSSGDPADVSVKVKALDALISVDLYEFKLFFNLDTLLLKINELTIQINNFPGGVTGISAKKHSNGFDPENTMSCNVVACKINNVWGEYSDDVYVANGTQERTNGSGAGGRVHVCPSSWGAEHVPCQR